MPEPLTTEMKHDSSRRPSFWQSMLRAGLPAMCLFHLIDYFWSGAKTGASFLRPSWSQIVGDVIFMLVFSALDWRRKNRAD
jgi:hypothetical protein